MEMSGAPTSTASPEDANNSTTVPAKGLGNSTTAFSVSTSTRTSLSATVSPGATCHATTTASVRPSPRSGSRKLRTSVMAGGTDRPRAGCDRRQARSGAELRGRVGRGEPTHPANWCLEGVEAVLPDAGSDFGTEAAEDRRLVDDDQSSGLAHRRLERFEVDR